MKESNRVGSGYHTMWLIVLFDLPVDSPSAKRNYSRFRVFLLKDGFQMLQFSVYARCFPGEEAAAVHRARIKAVLPPDGQVRLLAVTDTQFGKMQILEGPVERPAEAAPKQLLLF